MTSESIGQRLTRCREAMGLTTATAAARLHCDESIIVSLEADRFAEIGARVFAQGHLRRYADLVGAPTTELMADWAAQGAALAAPDLTKIPRAPMPAVDSQVWGRRLGLLAAAIVIAVAAWWILQGAGVSSQSAAAEPAVETDTIEVSGGVAPMVPETPIEAPPSDVPPSEVPPSEVAPAEGPPSEAPPSVSRVPSSATVVSATLAPAAEGRVVLAVDVRADCWVEIYDATGRKLYFDTVGRGAQARAAGQGPLRVLLGRADAASLQVGGRPVTIPAGFIRNSTAYFTVDAAGSLRPFAKPDATTGQAR
jgi:cytoskeleton protein RodZ